MLATIYPELTSDLKNQIIEKVTTTVRTCYVFEEDANKMADAVIARQRIGVFDAIDCISDLTSELSKELQNVKADRHLWVGPWLPPEEDADLAADKSYEEWLDKMPRRNFEFRKLEVLLGNVGYIDLRAFCPASIAGETATAAMQFLAHTEALIFDLRDNGGGDDLIQYLASYLLAKPIHMLSSHFRAADKFEQVWTYSFAPGPRFFDAPVYILVSSSTFSAAEGFAYALQKRGRVTVIGERTRGGAHPVEFYRFPELCLEMMIPIACSEEPITGGNWDDGGMLPDIEISADEALSLAHELALKTLLDQSAGDEIQAQRRWALESVQGAKKNKSFLTPDDLASYVGKYGQSIDISSDGSSLRLSWGGRRIHLMTPIGEHRFEFDHGTQRVLFRVKDGVPYELFYQIEDGQEWTVSRRES
jgi:retinol-binding protein 3